MKGWSLKRGRIKEIMDAYREDERMNIRRINGGWI